MVVILWVILSAVPFFIGTAISRCLYGKEYEKTCTKAENYIHGLCGLIGVAAVAHVASVFLHFTVKQMAIILWGGTLFLCAASLVYFILAQRKREKKSQFSVAEPSGTAAQLMIGALVLSVIFQIIIIMTEDVSYRDGDMTIETVQTFLTQNGIYQSNPLTGQPYVGGIPLRLKILCLPGLYASVCSLTGIDVGQFVGGMWPVVVLLGSYMAYGSLAKVLFPKDKIARLLMLLLVSGLFWMGDYMLTMDGFQLLHCGYRGTAIRNGILVPFTLCMCLKRKWAGAVLAILAEACIVWTLYGLGVCFFVTVLMLLVQLVSGMEVRRCRNS